MGRATLARPGSAGESCHDVVSRRCSHADTVIMASREMKLPPTVRAVSPMRILRSANTPFFRPASARQPDSRRDGGRHEVFVAAGPGDGADELAAMLGSRLLEIYVPRDIEPLADLQALWALYRLMRRLRPDITHSTTRSRLAVCHCRLPGARAVAIAYLHRAAVGGDARPAAFHYPCRRSPDRDIEHAELLRQPVAAEAAGKRRHRRAGRVRVVGEGSLSGVDTVKFARPTPQQREAARASHGLSADAEASPSSDASPPTRGWSNCWMPSMH